MNFSKIIKAIIRFYLLVIIGILELMHDIAIFLFPWYAENENKIDNIAVGLTFAFLIITAVVCLNAIDNLEMMLYQYETYQKFRFGL